MRPRCVECGKGGKCGEYSSQESTKDHRKDFAFTLNEKGSYQRVLSVGVISLNLLFL